MPAGTTLLGMLSTAHLRKLLFGPAVGRSITLGDTRNASAQNQKHGIPQGMLHSGLLAVACAA